MATVGRSDCPLSMSLELIGDRWTLLVLRDIIFSDRRHFRDLLLHSDEGIASNILAARLQTLVDAEILTKEPDLGHRQRVIYSLTDRGVDLLPAIIQLGAWGARNINDTSSLALWFRIADEQGPVVWRKLTEELRERHCSQSKADWSAEPEFSRLAQLFVDELTKARR